jgi:hypothetical protein
MTEQQTEQQLQLEQTKLERIAQEQRLAEQQQQAATAMKEREEIALGKAFQRAGAGTGTGLRLATPSHQTRC